MNSKKFPYVIVIVAAVIGAYLLIQYLPAIFEKKSSPKPTPQSDLNYVRKLDKYNLSTDETSPVKIAKALERLSQQNDPEVKEHILRHKDSQDMVVRQAAVEAAGSFYSEAEFSEVVDNGIQHNNVNVRIAALKGLSRQGSAKKEETVLKYLQKSNLEGNEEFEAHLALLKIAQDKNNREKAVNYFLAYLEKSGAPKYFEALRTVLSKLSQDPRGNELAKKVFNDSSVAWPIRVRSWQHLVAYDKEWTKSALESMTVPENGKFQMAILDAVKQICPSNWSSLIDDVISTAKEKNVKERAESTKKIKPCS
jgi:hypothetical protein